jgi:DNA-binding NarL/FixJ family response regulator
MMFHYETGFNIPEVNGDTGAIAFVHRQNAKPRVFVADDQEEVLRTIVATLQDEFQVVGMAANGQDVLRLVPLLNPEVLVLDIVMPLLNGIEAALRLKASGSSAGIVFLTVYEDRDFLEAAVSAAGAHAYVLKSYLATDLAPAIESVLKGRFFFSPCIRARDRLLESTLS